MADRADWDTATRAQRHLAVAADTELRRRHPGQHYPPLRSAEPGPATDSQRTELTLRPGQPPGDTGQWVKDLTAAHRTFAERLADRQSQTLPAEDPRYGDLGQAFPPRPGKNGDAILQPPKPEIRPSLQVLERAADRDTDWEVADLRDRYPTMVICPAGAGPPAVGLLVRIVPPRSQGEPARSSPGNRETAGTT